MLSSGPKDHPGRRSQGLPSLLTLERKTARGKEAQRHEVIQGRVSQPGDSRRLALGPVAGLPGPVWASHLPKSPSLCVSSLSKPSAASLFNLSYS